MRAIQRFELVELGFRCFIVCELQRSLEVIDARPEGAVDVIGRALGAHGLCAFAFEFLSQGTQDAAFADAGFSGQEHHLTLAVLRERPAFHEQSEFEFSSDQWRERFTMRGIEATLTTGQSRDAPRAYRFDDAFEGVFACVVKIERATNQVACVGSNHHLVRARQPLNACRDVGGLTDRELG